MHFFLGALRVNYPNYSLTIIPPVFFVLKIHLLFISAAYIQVHLRQDFFMQANNLNSDQTAYKIRFHIVCNILLKNISDNKSSD